MHLIEVTLAAVVFSAASGSSLQLWSRAASGSQVVEQREELQERIELDRLQLSAHWRRSLSLGQMCAVDQRWLLDMAAALPVPPRLQRQLLPDQSTGGVWVRWSADERAGVARQRLFTPTGLGLSCSAEVPQAFGPMEDQG